ncbi:hypothetical protein Tco_0158602 [Tanacetum coccineum]
MAEWSKAPVSDTAAIRECIQLSDFTYVFKRYDDGWKEGKGGNVMVLYASVHHDIPIVVNVSGRYKMDRHCGAFRKRLSGKSKKDGFIDIKSKTGDIHLFPVSVKTQFALGIAALFQVFKISHGRNTVMVLTLGDTPTNRLF